MRLRAALLVILLLAPGLWAQRRPRARVPRTPVDRWNQLSPEQRRRALEKLPPGRREAMQERVRRFNDLPPDDQQILRERYEAFSKLPPAKQDLLRRQIRRFHELPDRRRDLLRKEIGHLRTLGDEERRSRLQSEEFRDRFTPDEQELLRDLTENLAIDPDG